MDYAEILANFRKSSGKSQKEFAELLGLPQTTWAGYELGKTNPKLNTLLRLAEHGYIIPGLSDGAADSAIREVSKKTGLPEEEVVRQRIDQTRDCPPDIDPPAAIYEKKSSNFEIFRLKHGMTVTLAAKESDMDALVLLPVFTQTAAAGSGQSETQLQEIDKYIPIVLEMLGGANPKNCGIVRVVGDSMTDMNLFNGDFVIFDRTQIEGDGVYVISIGTDVRVKHLEYRAIEKKIVISSENAKRYPNPEVITYEQAENLLRIHGKVICWIHRNPY